MHGPPSAKSAMDGAQLRGWGPAAEGGLPSLRCDGLQ
jgi:hypothetical protein